MKITNGMTVKDIITGFVGVVMGRTEYITGCVQCGVSPRELKDGKPQDWQWLDESRLEQIQEGGVVSLNVSSSEPAGPQQFTAPQII